MKMYTNIVGIWAVIFLLLLGILYTINLIINNIWKNAHIVEEHQETEKLDQTMQQPNLNVNQKQINIVGDNSAATQRPSKIHLSPSSPPTIYSNIRDDYLPKQHKSTLKEIRPLPKSSSRLHIIPDDSATAYSGGGSTINKQFIESHSSPPPTTISNISGDLPSEISPQPQLQEIKEIEFDDMKDIVDIRVSLKKLTEVQICSNTQHVMHKIIQVFIQNWKKLYLDPKTHNKLKTKNIFKKMKQIMPKKHKTEIKNLWAYLIKKMPKNDTINHYFNMFVNEIHIILVYYKLDETHTKIVPKDEKKTINLDELPCKLNEVNATINNILGLFKHLPSTRKGFFLWIADIFIFKVDISFFVAGISPREVTATTDWIELCITQQLFEYKLEKEETITQFLIRIWQKVPMDNKPIVNPDIHRISKNTLNLIQQWKTVVLQASPLKTTQNSLDQLMIDYAVRFRSYLAHNQ